jgi:hypothetical protein
MTTEKDVERNTHLASEVVCGLFLFKDMKKKRKKNKDEEEEELGMTWLTLFDDQV